MHTPSSPRGFCGIALDQPKNSINVGAALRAATCFNAQFVLVSGKRIANLGSAPTDTFRSIRHIPTTQVEDIFDAIPHGCVPVAVDIIEGATPLDLYTHPERAVYIFGAEDQTLGTRITSRCRDVVYIPSNGCLNLAAAVNVVLYDRAVKLALKAKQKELEHA